jgi:hypothetical protein
MSKSLVFATLTAALAAGCAKQGMGPEVRSEISAKLATTQEPMQQCYARLLTTQRRLRGMVVAQAAIMPDGQFGDVTLRRDEPADPVLRFCIVQAIAGLRLDKPPGQRIQLESIPIKFEWSNP